MSKIVIDSIYPKIILPGGILEIDGKGFKPWKLNNKHIKFENNNVNIIAVSENKLVIELPKKAKGGELYIDCNDNKSNKIDIYIPTPIVTKLHNVDNPVIDKNGNIYATYSGKRGQHLPVSIFKIIPPDFDKHIFISEIPNPTSLAIDNNNVLFISSRMTGKIYKCIEYDNYEVYAQGLGVAFGLAINSKGEMFAGDRTGEIYQIFPNGQAIFYKTIPQSYLAYHLGFDKKDNLYLTNPIHMGENSILKINLEGEIETFHTSYSMYHGFCFDGRNNMYVVEGKRNESYILKITPKRKIKKIMTGKNLVGLCFDNKNNLLVATRTNLYLIDKSLLK